MRRAKSRRLQENCLGRALLPAGLSTLAVSCRPACSRACMTPTGKSNLASSSSRWVSEVPARWESRVRSGSTPLPAKNLCQTEKGAHARHHYHHQKHRRRPSSQRQRQLAGRESRETAFRVEAEKQSTPVSQRKKRQALQAFRHATVLRLGKLHNALPKSEFDALCIRSARIEQQKQQWQRPDISTSDDPLPIAG